MHGGFVENPNYAVESEVVLSEVKTRAYNYRDLSSVSIGLKFMEERECRRSVDNNIKNNQVWKLLVDTFNSINTVSKSFGSVIFQGTDEVCSEYLIVFDNIDEFSGHS